MSAWGDPLASFDTEFRPVTPIRPNIETLADGDYDMEIVDAARDKIKTDDVFRLGLRVASGLVVEKIYWLNRQTSVNAMGADLLVLGFDVDKWVPPTRPFSQEFAKVVPKMKGIRFRASKRTQVSTSDGKAYHNLYITCRLGAPANMPASSPASPLPAAPVQAQQEETKEIPF